jgi:hypothetical protein
MRIPMMRKHNLLKNLLELIIIIIIILYIVDIARGVIGEMRCGFLRIFAPTPYSAVFLLYAPAPVPTKIGFDAVRCSLVWCGVGVVLRFGLDSFGPDWVSSNVNFNLKNPFLQLKNLANYSLQHTNINVFNINLDI